VRPDDLADRLVRGREPGRLRPSAGIQRHDTVSLLRT
jgi:hypothetical protein